jgi:flagellar basal body-associated protein FliL
VSKTVIIAAGAVVAGGAVAAVLFLFVFGGGSSAADAGPTPEPTPVVVEGKLGPRLVIDSRVFNLQPAEDGTPAYLKLATVIEFETTSADWAWVLHGCVAEGAASPCQAEETRLLDEFDQQIGSGRTLIEDAITTIVSAKTLADVSTPDGKEQLRNEILDAVQHAIPDPHAIRVLFTDFVTQ